MLTGTAQTASASIVLTSTLRDVIVDRPIPGTSIALSTAHDYSLIEGFAEKIGDAHAEFPIQLLDTSAPPIDSLESISGLTAVYVPSVAAGNYQTLVESILDNCSFSSMVTDGNACLAAQAGFNIGRSYENGTLVHSLLGEVSTLPGDETIAKPTTLAFLGGALAGLGLVLRRKLHRKTQAKTLFTRRDALNE